jgi:hypothetical protein
MNATDILGGLVAGGVGGIASGLLGITGASAYRQQVELQRLTQTALTQQCLTAR